MKKIFTILLLFFVMMGFSQKIELKKDSTAYIRFYISNGQYIDVGLDENGEMIIPNHVLDILRIDSIATFGLSSTTNVTVSDSNAVRLNGKSTVYDDLFFPFTTGTSGGNPYPTFDVDSSYWHFVTDTTGPSKCIQYFTVQFPHQAKEGSIIISPHVHYKHTTGQGTPTFGIKYRWINIGESAVQKWKWIKLSSTTGTTDKTHQICNGTNISATGRTMSSILSVQVYLFSQTGTGGIEAYQFDIHYEIDALGSKQEYVK